MRPHPRRLVAIAVLAATLGACASTGATPVASPTPAASTSIVEASPGPSVAASAPASIEPADAFAFGPDPVVTPGAIIEVGGTLHMFANVFSAWPGRVQIVHLTSTDGAHWSQAGHGPAFTSDDVPFADPGAAVSTGYVAADGRWVLILESVSNVDPWVLGQATAPGPDGPWTVDPDPILGAGAAGSLDAGGLHWPSIVRAADGYRLYYAAFDHLGATGVIALATSPDGATWTKRDAPVLGPDRDWERGGLDRPRVAASGSGWIMVYAGARLTDRGEARSADGITWSKLGDGPVIDRTRFPVPAQAWDAALVVRDGSAMYYLEIGTSSGGTDVYEATAPLR